MPNEFLEFQQALENLQNVLNLPPATDIIPIQPFQPSSEIEIENKNDILDGYDEFLYKEVAPGTIAQVVLHICDIKIANIRMRNPAIATKLQNILEEDSLSKEEKNDFLNEKDSIKVFHRYHFTRCQIIQHFEGTDRYYASTRLDGKFSYSIINNNAELHKNPNQYLYPCKYCLNNVNLDGLPHEIDFTQVAPEFCFPECPYPLEGQHQLRIYPYNWKEIATRQKQRVNYTCTECNMSFLNNQQDLHCHHINHNPADCRFINLEVLCNNCHMTRH